MRARACLAIATLALPLLALPAALCAQDYEDMFDNPYAGQPKVLSLSAFGGTYWSSPWNDLVLLGSISSRSALEQVLLRQVQVSPARVWGGSMTYRRGRGGARIQVAYSKSCLEMAGSCDAASQGSGTQIPLPHRIDVHTWMADVDAEATLIPVQQGQWARPYFLVGAGGVVYDPQGSTAQLLPQFLEFPGGTAQTSGSEVTVTFPGAGQVIADVQGVGLQTVFSAVVGLGTDLRVPIGNGGIGVRIEASDHVAQSPMHVNLVQGFGRAASLDFGSINNFRLTVGAVLDLDLGRVKRTVALGQR